ncbi:MAG TPA: hypothetical protein VF765_32575 [Polyangiaceae bacterium]
MTASRRPSLAFALLVVVLAAVVAAVHVARLPEPLGVDQGLFVDFARWVPRGWLPYRDIFDSKPPLFLYWWTVAGLTHGDIVRAAWQWEGVWLAATLVAAFALCARVWDRWVGLAAAALLFVGLWSPAWGGFWSRAQAEELLALPMLGSAWLAWRAIDRPRLALAAGVLVGVCGLFKIPSMALALSWTVTWLACASARGAAVRVAFMGAGIALPWAGAFGWFAAHGATSDFIEGVFVYHRYNAAFIAPAWGDVLRDYSIKMVTDAPLLLVAAALGLFHLARARKVATSGAVAAMRLHWVAAWIVATMAAVVLQRQLAGYQHMLPIPALAVAGAYGIVETARTFNQPATRLGAAAVLVVLGGLFARDLRAWALAYGPDVACLRGQLPRDAYLRQIQPGAFSMADEELAAAWLRDHTSPDDGILVWGLSPGIYALADRHPTTRWPFHKILLTDAPLSRMWPGLDQRREAFLDRLQRDLPAYILIGQHDQNGFEPQDSFSSLGRFRGLRDILERDYVPDGQLGRFLRAKRTGVL